MAVYLSTIQTITRFLQASPSGGVNTAFWAVTGVSQGTGLAGILLLIVRRAKGLKFPRHGGEMLWIIVGIEAIMRLLRYPILFVQDSGWYYTAFFVQELLALGVWAAVYLYAIIQAKPRRWRVVFVVMVATEFVAPLGIFAVRFAGADATAAVSSTMNLLQELAIIVSVVIASWIDLRQPRRYPWSHWTGVVLYVLRFAGTVFWYILVLVLISRGA